jgi:hypothetical protein
MAYILHLIDAPEVSDAQEAEAFISRQYDEPASSNEKFSAFVRDIVEIYPDLSEEDEDGDSDENLWEEGLDSEASYGRVKELVVSVELTDEAVLAALVSAAVKNGLKLYDSEGEVLYPE